MNNYYQYLKKFYGKEIANNYLKLSTISPRSTEEKRPKGSVIINKLITCNDETKTMKEWAKELELTPNSFKYRYLKWGICERLFRKKSETSPQIKLITYEGETYSEAHWAKKLGINLHEFKKRLNKFGLDYQTFAPYCAIDSRFIIWQGKRKTKQRWARELGIDYSTFIYRLRKYGICDRTFLMKNGNVLK